ncbi:hypothetical protein F2Q68_00005406 [Brassica cretica]|uniref:Uncharacterized protein n=1 Tax=Brassica cretica TaxID=69181 RepID=A0A8S9J7R8_BRACR|nr:hypothetical protein F2Q68_00005406 [Brassica cretica]
MDSAVPPRLPRSPTETRVNQVTRSETVGLGNLLDESDVSKTHEKNLESEKREMAVTGGDNHVEGKGSGNHERRENQTGNEGNKEGHDVVNKEKVGQQSIKSIEDIEEDEIVKDWLDVTPEKASRGSNTLKYGQVGILTPSRFSTLLEVDEKGDTINPIEIEEILSIEEEIIEDEKEDTKEGEEVEGNMDEKSDKKEKGEEKDTEDSQNQGIAASVVASVATEQ